MLSAAFLMLMLAMWLSPVALWGGGITAARKMRRFRWLIHLVVIVAMPLLGPLLFTWAIMHRYGGELNAGVGMAVLPFVGMLAIALPGYVVSAFSLWRSSRSSLITNQLT